MALFELIRRREVLLFNCGEFFMGYFYHNNGGDVDEGYVCDYCGRTVRTNGNFMPSYWKYYRTKTFCSQRCLDMYQSDHPDSGGCFITTAVCQSRNLPDDCEELTILRKFRDEYMKPSELNREVEEYYLIAPKICKSIDSHSDSSKIYDDIYERWIKKSVAAVKNGEFENAHNIYKKMVLSLKEKYLAS